ncbi:hypothetical protein OG21DRAFT_119272 [Imleria badia]|nr:hypothetical protein OG21DRAFT_119272 [Imleria badia]
MAISDDLVVSGDKRITFHSLGDILPSSYFDVVIALTSTFPETMQVRIHTLSSSLNPHKMPIKKGLASYSPNFHRRRTRQHRSEIVKSECAANEQKKCLCEIIRSLRADLETQEMVQTNDQLISGKLHNIIAASFPLANMQTARRIASTKPSTHFAPFFAHGMNTRITKSHISNK